VSIPGTGATIPVAGAPPYRVLLSDTHPCDSSHLGDSEDIAAMNNMHEGPLLALLERRYTKDSIYTFTGDILISINPYKALPLLYAIPGLDTPLPDYKEAPKPHVFSKADAAYRSMLEETNPNKKNQSMIVSGESGAGKTEACKHVMRFLATLSERYCERNKLRDSSGKTEETASIEKKVLDCNPFLEAFGNAKTVRNDNSSRFGKFTKIEYDGGRIIGARIRHYLLEKARVVAPQHSERNYHIFYQVVRGATTAERAELKLGAPEEYFYLYNNGIAVTSVEGVNDAEEFMDVRSALRTVGIQDETQGEMWRLIAALLHLGNVKFSEAPCTAGGTEAFVTTPDVAALAGTLLGAPELPTKLVRRLMKVKGRSSAYEVALTERQAAVARDALSKTLYERLFTWLISKCNRILSSTAPSSAFIGILDIFGFEIFEINSFEQLCINYANEKLQNLFNHHIFVMEQAQYAADGVDVAAIEFINNQPCVDLIEKKPSGLLTLLDEICFLGRDSTDAEYLGKIDRAHKGVSKFYGGDPKKRSTDRFSVLHFAGEVHYCVDGFIDKNNDTLYTDLEELMTSSSFSLVRGIFDDAAMGDSHTDSAPATGHGFGANRDTDDGAGHSSPTVKVVAKAAAKAKTQSVSTISSKFKTQLTALNDTLLATSPHYVRCVKPNRHKRSNLLPQSFDHEMILTQLLYSGVLETVRIRRQGFPFRETFLEFFRRAVRVGFTCLVPAVAALPLPPAAKYAPSADGKMIDSSATASALATSMVAVLALVAALVPQGQWTKGRTKIFLKDGCYDAIIRKFRTYHALRLQSWWRMVKVRRWYLRARRCLIAVQRRYKGIVLRRKFAAVAKHVARVQATFRMKRAMKKYRKMRAMRVNAGAIVKATMQAMHAKRVYRRIREAWEKMQGRAKIRRAQKALADRRKALVILQSAVRAILAVVRFRRARKLRLYGSAMIQAAWRMHRARKAFVRIRVGFVALQALARGAHVRAHRRRMLKAVIRVQAMLKRAKVRFAFAHKRRAAITIQSWWRSRLARMHLKAAKAAVLRIERAYFARACSFALSGWLRSLHAACAWGETGEIEAVLSCRAPAHARLRHISVQDRLAILNRAEGFKTCLHAAVVSGSLPAVQLLVARGANPWTPDALASTPLHKAAGAGDAAAPTVVYLLSLAGGPPHSGYAANAVNLAGETVLDTAILAARASGRREHDAIVKVLIDAGGVTRVCGATVPQIQAALARPKPTVDSATAAAAAAAAREKEATERRARERRADPHYQLLFVAEAEREKARKRAAERAAVSGAMAAAALVEQAKSRVAAARAAEEAEIAAAYEEAARGGWTEGAAGLRAGTRAAAHFASPSSTSRRGEALQLSSPTAQGRDAGTGRDAASPTAHSASGLAGTASLSLAAQISGVAAGSSADTAAAPPLHLSLAEQYAELQARLAAAPPAREVQPAPALPAVVGNAIIEALVAAAGKAGPLPGFVLPTRPGGAMLFAPRAGPAAPLVSPRPTLDAMRAGGPRGTGGSFTVAPPTLSPRGREDVASSSPQRTCISSPEGGEEAYEAVSPDSMSREGEGAAHSLSPLPSAATGGRPGVRSALTASASSLPRQAGEELPRPSGKSKAKEANISAPVATVAGSATAIRTRALVMAADLAGDSAATASAVVGGAVEAAATERGGSSAYYPLGSSNRGAQHARESEWRVQRSSSTGLFYFYHVPTGTSQWSQPAGWDGAFPADYKPPVVRVPANAAAVLAHPAPEALPAMLGSGAGYSYGYGDRTPWLAKLAAEPPTAFVFPAGHVRTRR
jgi:myosin heavy subunit